MFVLSHKHYPRFVLAILALLSLGLTACGKTGRDASSPTVLFGAVGSNATLPRPEFKTDAELDSDSYPGEPDNDNNHVYGHAARAADARAATALVKHYYVAVAAGDGATACSLMYSVLAESVPESYGQSSGAQSSAGESCATIMSSMFEHRYKRSSSAPAALKAAAVRVRGNHAFVRFGFGGGKPKYYLPLRRERGVWKVDGLIGIEQAIYVE